MENIIDIEDLLDEDGNVIVSLTKPLFVNPKNVTGFNYGKVKAENKKKIKLETPSPRYSDEDGFVNYPDEILWEVISMYMSQHENENSLTTSRLSKSYSAVIFLINELYCTSPVFLFGMWTVFITKKNIEHFLNLSIKGWEQADDFAKILLAEMYFEFFDVVFGRYIEKDSEQYIPIETLSVEYQYFLKKIYDYPMIGKGNIQEIV